MTDDLISHAAALLPCPKCGENKDAWLKCSHIVCRGGEVFGRLPADPVVKADSCQPVRVKPLVWGDYPNRAFANPDVAVAEASFSHRYQAQRDPWANSFMAYLHPTAPIASSTLWWESKGHATIESAKAAAQADYKARILSAIEPQPDSRDAVMARLMEALAFYADESTYETQYERMPCDCCTDIFEPINDDKGSKARAAIAAAKGGVV